MKIRKHLLPKFISDFISYKSHYKDDEGGMNAVWLPVLFPSLDYQVIGMDSVVLETNDDGGLGRKRQ